MKKIISLFLLLFTLTLSAQVSLVTWNLRDFGKSKSEETIDFIAATVRDHDIIAIQEVVAGYGGAQAVSRLADALNRKGAKWDYTISEPTSGDSYKKERYAFLWKTKNITKIGKAWLENHYHEEIDREPYLCTFEYKGKTFTVVTFHAITKKKQPETEIKYFKFLPALYPGKNLIFTGDFNCPQSHTVFNPLKKMGYVPVFALQKTSLKKECASNNCLASEFDNIFYNTAAIQPHTNTALLFFKEFATLEKARSISDHIPLQFSFFPK